MTSRAVDDTFSEYHNQHVAIVYQYLPPSSPDDVWYHKWGLNVMAFLGYGFESLGLSVRYIDIGSFLHLDRNEFNEIDYSVNLICGNVVISHWTLVPAISAWHGIAPMPLTADAMLAGERKDLATLCAKHVGFDCPRSFASLEDLPSAEALYVMKPRDFGSSIGLHVGTRTELSERRNHPKTIHVIEEFVWGIDVTVPAIFDPDSEDYDFGHAVALIPDHDARQQWVFGTEEKSTSRKGGNLSKVEKFFFDVPNNIKDKIRVLIRTLGGSAVARIDFRVRAGCKDSLLRAKEDDYVFIEVNPIPTISDTSNYVNGLRHALDERTVFSDGLRAAVATRFPPKLMSNVLIAYSMLRHARITSTKNVLSEKPPCDE